jgi:nucleotide-binding universal stress UspA family protein
MGGKSSMKALICITGLPGSEPTVHTGGLFARLLDARADLLTVVARREEVECAERDLARWGVLPGDVAGERLVRVGNPTGMILREEEAGGYSLLVVGAKISPAQATSPKAAAVARAVARRARSSVLVAKTGLSRLRRILVCTGGDRVAEPVVRMGARLAQASGAEVTLLHVTSAVPSMYTGLEAMNEHLAELLRSDTPVACHLKRCIQIMAEHQVDPTLELRRGTAAEEVLRASDRGHHDVVVIGTPARTRVLQRFLLGDVAWEIARHAARSILLVRGEELAD